jgi:hypothetical protein
MRIILYSLSLLILSSCHTGSKTSVSDKGMGLSPDFRNPGPPTMVYKTRKNYNDKVAIILSPDKSEIISYPDPADIDMSKVLPAPLANGFLLDNRGIDPNVAFLKMTYAEYAKLPKAPSKEELYKMIIDKNPIKEMCNCGNRKSIDDPVSQINYLITHRELESTCKQLK